VDSLRLRRQGKTASPGAGGGKPHFGYEPGVPVLDKFKVTINAGDRVAIIGENGVGKTTLLRLLMGELNCPMSAR
jgi:ATPase subunit of ABC transporter with duplicated ATPase domains